MEKEPGTQCADPGGELNRILSTKRFGRKVFWHRSLGSTNDEAARLAGQGEAEGTLVVAEEQTMGRGRERRTWHSPPFLGWYFSLILRPPGPAHETPLQTFVVAVALTEVIRDRCGLPATIRWPNDILIRGRKTAGILAEVRTSNEAGRGLVIGVGWNLNHRREDFPEELRDRATSLLAEGGRKVSRLPLLAALLEKWEIGYAGYFRAGPESLLNSWKEYSPESTGAWIRLDDGKTIHTGRTRGIGPDGALLLEGAKGKVTSFRFGEVRRLLEVRS